MMFNRAPLRLPTSRVRAAVFAIGQRAYVACTGDKQMLATLMDDAGHTAMGDIGDGAEVAIVAWRQASGDATRYCVRVKDSGVEGWLRVRNLRRTEAAVATVAGPPAALPTPPLPIAAATAGRRAGARH